MIFQKFIRLSIAIYILLTISVKSQAEGCCEFDQCSFEKLKISQQLLTIASQIQSQVVTSRKQNDCSTSSSITAPTTKSTTTFEPPTISTTTFTTSEPSTFTTTTATTTTSEAPTTYTTTTITTTSTTAEPTITRLYIVDNPGNFTYAKSICFNTNVKRKSLTIDTRTEWDSEVKVKLRQSRGNNTPYSWPETQMFWIDASLVGGVWFWGDMTPVDLTYLPLKLWSGLTQASNQTALMLVYERLVDDFYLSPVDPATKFFPYDPKITNQLRIFCEYYA